ncbi:MAG: DUF1826 domain-containing protein [Cohaesibacter sp.]|jgi:hypothetical protein|nr:DUF1826 domain-containing protein [Cohaesibacter sp.]
MMINPDLTPNVQNQPQPSTERPAAVAVLMGREPEILNHICRQGVAAAIWQRCPISLFQNWVDALHPASLPQMRTIAPVNLVEDAVRAACDISKISAGSERDMLASDIAALAFMFSKIMNVQTVQVRLDVDDDVMCPRFHKDNVRARLLCTYRGPATQYIDETKPETPKYISQMTTGSVGIFRGKKWPSKEPCSLLHRSPHLPLKAVTRMLLVIDPVG